MKEKIKTITKKIQNFKFFVISFLTALLIILTMFNINQNIAKPDYAYAQNNEANNTNTSNSQNNKEVRILFTTDIHSYFTPTYDIFEGRLQEHGNSARLATLLKNLKDQNSVYIDAGDITSGTLLESEYKENAEELKFLGQLGCDIATWGNHEFDYGGYGLAQMLNNASNYKNETGANLPQYVQSNIDFTENLTDEQKTLKGACENYGVQKYVIKNINGTRVAFFGLEGPDSIECAPTNGQNWTDYKEAAKNIVAEIGDKADIKVCLSHSESKKDIENGDDADLAYSVPGIDLIIGAHAHNSNNDAKKIGNTYIVSAGCYMYELGDVVFNVNSDNKAEFKSFNIHKIDESVTEDSDMKNAIANHEESVSNDYLKKYSPDCTYNTVLGRCDFDFMGTDQMEAEAKEYPIGNLIADSYRYEAESCGIEDIDVCAVGYGTIRDGFHKGEITTNDVFKVCPLGAGSDNSAGHPLIITYFNGKDVKLLTQLETSLGSMKQAIVMSYSGLELTYNKNRMMLDKITDIHLIDKNGQTKEIEDDKLYKVCLNAYSMNMLGMVNNISKGIISITARNADGSPMEDIYANAMKTKTGQEVKEWIALKDYVKELKVIPETYDGRPDRKLINNEGGFAVIANPGLPTIIAIVFFVVIAGLIVLITYKIVKRVKRPKK